MMVLYVYQEGLLTSRTCQRGISVPSFKISLHLVLLPFQAFCPVLDIIVREHAEECRDSFDGVSGLWRDRLLPHPQEHYTIEGVEASLYLSDLLVTFLAQFHYEG